MRRLTSDPSSLADATGPTTTVVDPKLAAAIAAGDAPVPGAQAQASIDSFGRSVVRQYKPMTAQQATAAAMARIGTDTPQQRLNTVEWALSGQSDKPQTPFGSKPKAETSAPISATPATARPAGAAAVKCLEGVRRLPGVVGPAQPQGC